jgi:hypothetical protein
MAKRSRQKLLEQVGSIALLAGVVLGMGVSSIPSLNRGVQIGLLLLALILVAGGLVLVKKYRAKSS